jgi:hypothetical protein
MKCLKCGAAAEEPLCKGCEAAAAKRVKKLMKWGKK